MAEFINPTTGTNAIADPKAAGAPPQGATNGTIEFTTGQSIGTPNSVRVFHPNNKVQAIVILGLGLLAAIIGYAVYSQATIPASFARTTGTVVSEAPFYSGTVGSTSSGGITQRRLQYRAVINFKVGSQTYNFTDSQATNPPAFPVGSNVQVAYNPSNPNSNPRNASSHTGKILGPIVLAVGIAVIIFGVVKLLKRPSQIAT